MPSTLVRAVRAGDVDLGITFDYPEAGRRQSATGSSCTPCSTIPSTSSCRRGHRLARRRQVRVADLAGEGWLLPDFGPASPSFRLIARVCARPATSPDRLPHQRLPDDPGDSSRADEESHSCHA